MKKFYLSLAVLAFCGMNVRAQLSSGGLPQSMKSALQSEDYVTKLHYPLPDWESFIKKNDKEEQNGISRPYKFGLPVATDISFPESGTFVTEENGIRVWRAQVQITSAPAIGFYYDKFHLPEGVQMFLSNDNHNQVLGAYTITNNTEDGLFANEAVLGDVINIELNINPEVSLADIQLHINQALVYFRSYEYLNKYKTIGGTENKPTDPDLFGLEGSSSLCQINAICPLGQNYPKQRKSIVQILDLGGGLCSATLINNTGNSPANCKNYVLTATHCEPNDSTGGPYFSQLLVRFNFEKTQCTGGPDATVNTLRGVDFRARAKYYDTIAEPTINGDFLLMQLKTTIPTSWDAYMAGWNRATTMPATLTYPKRYIGFHHPQGDVKKVSTSKSINPNGEGGGSMGPGTHWSIIQVDSGGIGQGSSGSGLFDGEGRLIGIASVAGNADPNCDVNDFGEATAFLKFVNYGKFSLAWDYALDGTANNRKLKPWLDPTNAGVMTLDAVKSNCSDATPPVVTGLSGHATVLGNSISIYPNPSTTGKITARMNFAEAANIDIEVFDVTGAKVLSSHLNNVLNGAYAIDLSAYTSGMYLVRFNDGNAIATKKIMLSK